MSALIPRSAATRERSRHTCLISLLTCMVSACVSILSSICAASANFLRCKSWFVRFRKTRVVPVSFCHSRLRVSFAVSAQRFVVSPTQAGQRLDRALAHLTSATRSHVKVLIEQERGRVAGKPQNAGYRL